MARWEELTEAQQNSVTAFTRSTPNDKPNGPAEAAIEKIARLLSDTQHTAFVCAMQRLFAELCEAEADQVKALRLAFNLGADGVTPITKREG